MEDFPANIRVLELGQAAAAPFAGMFPGDPGGDEEIARLLGEGVVMQKSEALS